MHLLLYLAALLGLPSPQAAAPAAHPRSPVRLIVLVSIDQFTPEALEPLLAHLGGGLSRFLEQGTAYPRALLAHGVTETAPGHATLGTGCTPARHGVVANDWTSHARDAWEYCFDDPDVRPLRQAGPAAGPGRSPRNLRRPALAELLRSADGAARSVAIAGKDRAAIGMAGRADWCLWWDLDRGGFQSSTAWGRQLPAWVRDWNEGWIARVVEGPFGGGWKGARAAGLSDAPPDERAGEGGRRFPYARPQIDAQPGPGQRAGLATFAWESPACDALIVDLACRALDALELGADEHVDLLALGLSACDVVGHRCGPGSREIADLLLCADAALGELFARLDQRVGRGRWIAALTADHGVMPLPEALAARGVSARRVPADAVSAAYSAARAALEERYGSALGLRGDARGAVLSWGAADALGVDLDEAREVLATALEQAGSGWIERALTWQRLRAVARAGAEADELLRAEAASFDEDRAPDVSLVVRRWTLVAQLSGTSHGSPHDYDREVPLYFLGPGFEPGPGAGPADTIDVAPTLLDRAGVALPADLDGRVLAPR